MNALQRFDEATKKLSSRRTTDRRLPDAYLPTTSPPLMSDEKVVVDRGEVDVTIRYPFRQKHHLVSGQSLLLKAGMIVALACSADSVFSVEFILEKTLAR